MPLPTPPSSVAVASYTATSVVLSWTVGAGDHYDVYRAPIRRTGFYGPWAKVNASNVSIAATGFSDSGVNSLNPPTENQSYCYLVYAVASDGSQLAASPVFASSFSGVNPVHLIHDAILSRASSVLVAEDSSWAEVPRVRDLEDNPSNKRDKMFGVLIKEALPVAGKLGGYTFDHRFRFWIQRELKQVDQTDADLKSKLKDELSHNMQLCYIDFLKSKLGLSSIIMKLDIPIPGEPEFFQENNLVVLGADLVARYHVVLA